MKKWMAISMVAAAAATAAGLSWGYETATHQLMSVSATEQSRLVNVAMFHRLGLVGSYSGGAGLVFPSSEGFQSEMNPRDLIGFGSIWEDDRALEQALRHLYNPRNGLGLTAVTAFGTKSGEPSPKWAVDGGDSNQMYSYKKAREYFYDALTKPSGDVERKVNWGKTFQTLGHVIHHLQDMAQPQHVRNDIHCDLIVPCKYPVELLVTGTIYHPSLYEKWVRARNADLAGLPSYAPVNDPADGFEFKLPKQFWSTGGLGAGVDSGKGIAEYTNRGFLSAGTIMKHVDDYPVPDLATMTESTAELSVLCDLDPGTPTEPGRGCPAGAAGPLTFYGNTVVDSLRSTGTTDNMRAASSSIYDEYLMIAGSPPVLALNRFNLRDARDILVPRAIGYSAGLINYFFRGNMVISLPDEGVYSIVDHSTKTGFSKIKLKLAAPASDLSGNPQSLSGGKLVAVLKFRRNNCYKDDLTGYPPFLEGNDNFESCPSVVEELVVSGPANSGADVALTPEPQPFTFDFGTELPLKATNLLLQVVYKGRLGEEDGAVVVATQDIGEPTFFSYMNASDYYTLAINGAAKVFTRSEIDADPDKVALVQPPSCIDNSVSPKKLKPECLNPFDVKLGLMIGGSGGVAPTKIEIEALPPKRFMRIALLGNAGTIVALAQSDTNNCYPHDAFQVDPLEWQKSYDGSGTLLKYAELSKVRDVAQWYGTSCVGTADGLAPGTPDNRDEGMTIALDDKSPIAVKINGDAGF